MAQALLRRRVPEGLAVATVQDELVTDHLLDRVTVGVERVHHYGLHVKLLGDVNELRRRTLGGPVSRDVTELARYAVLAHYRFFSIQVAIRLKP